MCHQFEEIKKGKIVTEAIAQSPTIEIIKKKTEMVHNKNNNEILLLQFTHIDIVYLNL